MVYQALRPLPTSEVADVLLLQEAVSRGRSRAPTPSVPWQTQLRFAACSAGQPREGQAAASHTALATVQLSQGRVLSNRNGGTAQSWQLTRL